MTPTPTASLATPSPPSLLGTPGRSATRLDLILEEVMRLQPAAIILDSIQTVYLDEIPSSAGSVTQVGEGG